MRQLLSISWDRIRADSPGMRAWGNSLRNARIVVHRDSPSNPAQVIEAKDTSRRPPWGRSLVPPKYKYLPAHFPFCRHLCFLPIEKPFCLLWTFRSAGWQSGPRVQQSSGLNIPFWPPPKPRWPALIPHLPPWPGPASGVQLTTSLHRL